MVYLALLPLMRTPRLQVIDWTDAPADLKGLVSFAERRNLVSARVPSHFKRSLPSATYVTGYLLITSAVLLVLIVCYHPVLATAVDYICVEVTKLL